MIWRRAQIDALYQDVPAPELLQRLQGRSRWLRDQDLLYFDGDREQAANDELFSKMWAIWSDLELAYVTSISTRAVYSGQANDVRLRA